MKWSITQLRKYQGKPFEFNEKANFDDLIEPLGLIDLSEMNIEGELTIKSNEVIADMHVPLDVRTSEIFDLEGYNSYTDEEVDEDEHYHLATDGMINIRDIAKELVIIEKPMRAFSENSDQMLTEGNGWEVIDEEQALELEHSKDNDDSQTRQVDPRLQKLQQLYDKE